MRRVILVLSMACLLCSSACTAFRPTQAWSGSSQAVDALEIKVGDRIQVVTLAGAQYTLTVSGLRDTGVDGWTQSGETLSIDYQDVSELRVRGFAVGRTAGLAAGIAAAILIMALDDAAFFPDGPTFPAN